MNLSNILKDPIDIPLLLIYVTGVLIMVYSAMQFVHYFIYKSKSHLRSGIKTLILALVLLAPRLVYQRIRIDGSDYKNSVKAAIKSVTEIYETSGSGSSEKAQMDALSGRLSEYGYSVTYDTSVETKANSSFTIRNLCAVKKADIAREDQGFILVSTVLGAHDGENGPLADAANASALEALARMLKDMDSDTELRFLISSDGREGQDAAYDYISRLSDQEKKRLLMNISFDLSSLSDYTGFELSTVNGVSNPLSLSMKASVKKMTGQTVTVQQKKDSQIVSFHVYGIPSAALSQAYVDKAEEAKSLDKLNEDEIGDMAAIIGNILMPIMKAGDSELLNEFKTTASDNNPYISGSFRSGKDVFSREASLQGNDTLTKADLLQRISENFGVRLTDTGLTDSSGKSLYSGNLYLLTFDSPVTVLFHIGESGLSCISIDSKDLPVSKEELSQILTNLFGEPEKNGVTSVWSDEKSGAGYVLSESVDDLLISSDSNQ